MSTTPPRNGRAGQTEPVEFSFRYTRHGNVRRYGVALMLGIGLAIWQAGGDDPLILAGIGLAIGAATYAFYRALCRYVPTAPDAKLVTVDDRGLTVDRLRIDSHRIGEVVELDAEAAYGATHTLDAMTFLRAEVEGRRTARMRMVYPFWHELPALMVEDVGAEDPQRRWWLLAVPEHVDQAQFAAALRSVRAGGRPTGPTGDTAASEGAERTEPGAGTELEDP